MKTAKQIKIIPSKVVCDICGDPMKHGWFDFWVHMRFMGYASAWTDGDEEDTRLWKMRKLDVCEDCFNKFKKWVKENENNS